VPIKILQTGSINFNPALSEDKWNAINEVHIPPGMKVFIEFSKRFYPDIQLTGPLLNGESSDKLYYNAAFKKDTNHHVMALFYVSDKAVEFTELESEDLIISKILDELDEMFDGAARRHYVKHIIQNWSKEPFIQGSYSFYGSNESSIKERIKSPIQNKVYFAGEALAEDESSTVHGAGLSAYEVTESMIG